MGSDMTQDERNALWDELEAFFAFIEDPDSDLDLILAVEGALEVTL
ncbi:hypothetical protein ACGFYA_20425 [Streptomyces sp. NPDC048305]